MSVISADLIVNSLAKRNFIQRVDIGGIGSVIECNELCLHLQFSIVLASQKRHMMPHQSTVVMIG